MIKSRHENQQKLGVKGKMKIGKRFKTKFFKRRPKMVKFWTCLLGSVSNFVLCIRIEKMQKIWGFGVKSEIQIFDR